MGIHFLAVLGDAGFRHLSETRNDSLASRNNKEKDLPFLSFFSLI